MADTPKPDLDENARTRRMTPPFSPVLLAGMAVRPLPLFLLQPALKIAIDLIHRRHPEVFERLSGLDDPVFLIDPVDLPFCFVLHPDPLAPSLTALRDPTLAEGVTATIRGPLLALLQLLEGRTDGDALFFSRALVIEGDTSAVVALRNAVDGAEIDIVEDFLSALGPLSRPARTIADGALGLLDRAARDLEVLRDALIAPALRRADGVGTRLDRLDRQVAALGKDLRRGAGARHRKESA